MYVLNESWNLNVFDYFYLICHCVYTKSTALQSKKTASTIQNLYKISLAHLIGKFVLCHIYIKAL